MLYSLKFKKYHRESRDTFNQKIGADEAAHPHLDDAQDAADFYLHLQPHAWNYIEKLLQQVAI